MKNENFRKKLQSVFVKLTMRKGKTWLQLILENERLVSRGMVVKKICPNSPCNISAGIPVPPS